MSNKNFRSRYLTDKISSPKLQWKKSKLRLRFEGSCSREDDRMPLTPSNVVNLFIVYELDPWPLDLDAGFTLSGCLYGGV